MHHAQILKFSELAQKKPRIIIHFHLAHGADTKCSLEGVSQPVGPGT